MKPIGMSLQRFVELLAGTPRDWTLAEGKIRRGPPGNPECPITAVAQLLSSGPSIPAAAVVTASRGLRMSAALVSEVVKAADAYETCDPLFRMELMEACGLLVEEGEPAVEQAGR